MDRRLAAAEALAPDDADLRAGAWGLGRGMPALPRRTARRQPRVRQGPRRGTDQHGRILNPYQGPELLLQALAGEGHRPGEQAAASAVRAARWPQRWAGTTLRSSAAPTATSRGPARRWRPPWRPVTLPDILRHRPTAGLRSGAARQVGGSGRAATVGRRDLHPIRGPPRGGRLPGPAARPPARPPPPQWRRQPAGGLLRAGVTRREAEALELVADRLAISRSPSACTSRPERSKSTSRP